MALFINGRSPEKDHPEFDSDASLIEARASFSLRKVMAQYGHGPKGDNWKSFTCPFCKKKSKAGLFQLGGVELFRCRSTKCRSRDQSEALDEVGFVGTETGLSRKDAFVTYLKMAGVWKERTRFKSRVLPKDTSAPNATPPSASPPDAAEGTEVNDSSSAVPPLSLETPIAQTPPTGAGDSSPGAPSGGASVPETSSGTTALDGPEAAAAVMDEPPLAVPEEWASAAAAAEGDGDGDDEPEEDTEGDGYRALRAFYDRLTLSDRDEEKLFVKRGFMSETISALGFRSNPKSNRAILEALGDEFSGEELAASGLWKKGKPNAQFYGWGVIGKKPKPAEGEEDEDEGDFDWGWVQPILIPYFDGQGKLIALRPHKGMGRRGTLVGTPHLYIPRRAVEGRKKAAPERFRNVVVTEGEYKAGALWQMVGEGRDDEKEPWGAASLPGISFGKNYEVREELDGWLRTARAGRMKVAFDNEEKGDPALASYKPEKRKRYDSIIWARYLALDIHRKRQIRTEVCVLPKEWRDAKGKADWDGFLAREVAA